MSKTQSQIAAEPTLEGRAHDILEARSRGETLQTIGDRYGVTKQAIHLVVKKRLAELRELTEEAASELKQQARERLDMAMRHAVAELTADDPKVRMSAVDAIVEIEARRARLEGLDAPARSESKLKVAVGAPDVTDMTPEQLADIADAIATDLRKRGGT